MYKIITPYVLVFRYPLLVAFIFSVLVYPDLEVTAYGNDSLYNGEIINSWLRPLVFTIRFYPYYLLGMFVTRDHIMTLRVNKYKLVLIPMMLVSLYACATKTLLYHDPDDSLRVNTVLYAIASLSCLATIIAYMPGKALPSCTKLGQKSLGIYIFHLIVIRILIETIAVFQLNGFIVKLNDAAVLIIFLLIIYLICLATSAKYLMKAFNQFCGWIENFLFPRKVLPKK